MIYAAELYMNASLDTASWFTVSPMIHSFSFRRKFSMSLRPSRNMVAAIADISRWSASHRLKLNPDKSEVIWLGTRQQLAKLCPADKTLQLHDSTLMASTTVRNLGVQLDSELNFDDQARYCVKACYYHLRRILQIRRHVDNCCLYAVSYTPLCT